MNLDNCICISICVRQDQETWKSRIFSYRQKFAHVDSFLLLTGVWRQVSLVEVKQYIQFTVSTSGTTTGPFLRQAVNNGNAQWGGGQQNEA